MTAGKERLKTTHDWKFETNTNHVNFRLQMIFRRVKHENRLHIALHMSTKYSNTENRRKPIHNTETKLTYNKEEKCMAFKL